MLKEFRAFVLRGNVVDLAVGVVIGAAFGRVVDSIVKGIFAPLLTLSGDSTLETLGFTVGRQRFTYGSIIDEVIAFLILAAVIFFLVVKPLNHLTERFGPSEPVDQASRECPWCISSIPMRARRCQFCTAEVEPVAG